MVKNSLFCIQLGIYTHCLTKCSNRRNMRKFSLIAGALCCGMAAQAQYVFRPVDIFPANGNGSPILGTIYQDKMFLSARTSGFNFELYTSNGWASGTTMLKDLNPGPAEFSVPKEFVHCNGKLFFLAFTDAYGLELWITDGTAAGTNMVKDINPGTTGTGTDLVGTGRPLLTVVGHKVYFMADDGTNGPELWCSDGTAAGTIMLKDINTGADGSYPIFAAAYGNKLIFCATSPTYGDELWSTDGTPAGTQMIKDIRPGATGSGLGGFIVYNNKVYFNASNGTNGNELWSTDGTDAGTTMVKDICPGPANSGPGNFIVYNNKLYFCGGALAPEGYELWVTDGTTAGTTMVKDIFPGAGNSIPSNFIIFKNKLFFSAKGDASTGTELWMSDGTAAGTQLVKDLAPGPGPSNPRTLTVHKNKLYFVYSVSFLNEHLAVSDGTAAGTMQIAPPGANLDDPLLRCHQFIEYHDTLYFNGFFNAAYGEDLWAVTDTSSVPSGIGGPTAAAFSLYPNPSGGVFTIRLQDAQAAETHLQVLDMAGRSVHSQHMAPGTRSTVLQLSHLPKGTYTLRLQAGDGPPAGERLLIQ